MTYPALDDDDSFLVYLMGMELDRRCRDIARASRLMKKAVRRDDVEEAFFYVESLLASAAAISRIFWPKGWERPRPKTLGERAALLRRVFRLTSRSVFYTRDVRNSFEHFDERLGEQLASGLTLIVDANIGSPAAIGGTGFRILRNLDPTTWSASYLNETADLPRLLAAARAFRRERLIGVTPMLDMHMGAAMPGN